jgi:hypothetical protein
MPEDEEAALLPLEPVLVEMGVVPTGKFRILLKKYRNRHTVALCNKTP